MFLLPIDSDAVRRGRFPLLTALLILACLGIHFRHGETHERLVELRVQQARQERAQSEQTQAGSKNPSHDRNPRAAQDEIERELEKLESQDLISRWAFRPSELDGAADTGAGIFTHAFVHGSWFHLLSNMLMLYLLGVPLERRFGFRRTSSLYATGMIAGALGYWAMHYGSEVSMVGASGAIAALMGAFVIFFHRSMFTFFYVVLVVIYPLWGTVRAPALLFLPLWIVIEIVQLLSEGAGLSAVAHSAHVGGFLAGVVVALVWKLPVFAEQEVDESSPGGRAATLRSRLRAVRGLLTATPRDLALCEEALFLSLELGELEAAARELLQWVEGLARDPARLVAAYRTLREHSPSFVATDAVLAQVHAAAVRTQDHWVVVETTHRWIEQGKPSAELWQAMFGAAVAQDALGRDDLAAQTRSFLWSLGARPVVNVADSAAAPIASLQRAAQSAEQRGVASAASTKARRTCAAHNLVAIGGCGQCNTPVCAACSRMVGNTRQCRDCHGNLASARADTKRDEANLHAFGVLWQIWGLTLLALTPLVLLLPPDYAIGAERTAGVAMASLGLIGIVLGRGLARLKAWIYWPALFVSVLFLIQPPIGSAIGAFTLNVLLRARGRRILTAEYARLRELSPELDPRFGGLTRQWMLGGGCLLGLLVFSGYALLVSEQVRARRLPQTNEVEATIFRPWTPDRSFRLRTELTFDESRPSKPDAADVHSEILLEARAKVLSVDETGWPISVSYEVERMTAELEGEKLQCHNVSVLVKGPGDLRMLGDCGERLSKLLMSALLPASRPEFDDPALFEIERGSVEPGRTFDADDTLLAKDIRAAPLPFVAGEALSGTLSVARHERCGWPTCVVLDKEVAGDITAGTTRDGLAAKGGEFQYTTKLFLPVRAELVSFALRESLDYSLRDDESTRDSDGSPAMLSAKVALSMEVRAVGDNASFEQFLDSGLLLARGL